MIIMMMNIMIKMIMIYTVDVKQIEYDQIGEYDDFNEKKVVTMMIYEDLYVEYTIMMIITLNMMMLMMITKVERKREQMVGEA